MLDLGAPPRRAHTTSITPISATLLHSNAGLLYDKIFFPTNSAIPSLPSLSHGALWPKDGAKVRTSPRLRRRFLIPLLVGRKSN